MPYTAIAYSGKDLDVIDISEAWKLDNNVGQWRLVPQAIVRDRRSQNSNRTTYELADLNTWLPGLGTDGGLVDWDLGDSLPIGRIMSFTSVTIDVATKSTHVEDQPADMPADARIQDLVDGLVPGLMSLLNGGLEVSLVNHIKSVTPTALTGLTGGTISSAAPGEVIKALEALLQSLRVFTPAGSTWFRIVCYVTEQADDLMRTVADYAGRGNTNLNTDKESILDTDEFAVRFQRAHKIAAYRVISSSAVDARFGTNRTDAAIVRLGGYEMFFVVEDNRSESWDIRSPLARSTPDGGLVLAVCREPEIITIDEDRQKTEMIQYVGRAGWQFFSPRGDIMRRRVDPGDIA